MKTGDYFSAPEGFESLEKGVEYSYFKTSAESEEVILIEFLQEKPGKSGRRIRERRVGSRRYSQAIDSQQIQPVKKPPTLPAWLYMVDGASLDEIDLERDDPAKTNRSRCEERYSHIAGLLGRLDEIADSPCLFSILNKHANECTPKQNRSRIAEWLFAYVCHGFDLMALYPEYPKVGQWDRTDGEQGESHHGRPPASATNTPRYPSHMFAEEIKAAFLKRADLGISMKRIYRVSLEEDWGCRARDLPNNGFEMYHPENKPFPDTYGKFRHQVIKAFGLRAVQETCYGKARVRAKMAATVGSYSEEIGSLLEQMEVDAYYLKERPISPISGEIEPRLCVARAVCKASKNVIGVGFSYENETAEAYSSMLFSAAINKDEFTDLFGLKGGILPWPCEGLAPHIISDRGAAPIAAIVKSLVDLFPVKELAESYSGQSKPDVESGHPRDIKTEGQPNYLVSKLNVVQLIQREIARAARDNHTSQVKTQAQGRTAMLGKVTTPYSLWVALDAAGKNQGIRIPYESAVRRFQTKTTFEVGDGYAFLNSRKYSSREFRELDAIRSLAPGQKIEINGYHLSMCLTYVWVEIGRQLLKLKVTGSYRMTFAEESITKRQLDEQEEHDKTMGSASRQSIDAAAVEANARFFEATGMRWSTDTRRQGRIPKITQLGQAAKGIFTYKKPSRKAA